MRGDLVSATRATPVSDDITPVVGPEHADGEYLERGWTTDEWERPSFDAFDFDHRSDGPWVESEFLRLYVDPALEIGQPRRGYGTEAEAIAAMRATKGDQHVIEVGAPKGDPEVEFESDLLEVPGGSRFVVIEAEPYRGARESRGFRAKDADVHLTGSNGELYLHHRDVAREVDGIEFVAHDGWFLTPGEVDEGTFG